MVAARSNLDGEGNLQLVVEVGEIKLFSIVQPSFQNIAITNPTETTTEDTPNSAICFSSSIKMTIHPLKLNNSNNKKKTNKQRTSYFQVTNPKLYLPNIAGMSQPATDKVVTVQRAGLGKSPHLGSGLSQYVPGN